MGYLATMNERIRLVEEHIRAENSHDVDAIMATLGSQPGFVVNGTRIDGRDGVRGLYESLGFGNAGGFSDLEVDIAGRHIAEDSITLEVLLRGRHTGEFQGIPATGKTFELPLCAVITFDAEGKMAGERLYFDSSLLMRQLGLSG